MKTHQVALCGLSVRDQRLIEIVVNRQGFASDAFQALDMQFAKAATIAIFDAQSDVSLAQYTALQRLNPQVVGVAISEQPTVGDGLQLSREGLLGGLPATLVKAAGRHASTGAPDVTGLDAGPAPHAWPHPQPPPLHVVDATAAAARAQGQPSAPREAAPLRALVVDASPAVRQQLQAGLRRLGFSCHGAGNASEAQAALRDGRFNLMLLDAAVEGMDGYTLCHSIKRDRYLGSMPVVMLAPHGAPFNVARGISAGCDAHLARPMRWDEFRERVEAVMLQWAGQDRERLAGLGFTLR